MANDVEKKIKIEDLPEASLVNGSDIVPIVQNDGGRKNTKRTSISDIGDHIVAEQEYDELNTTSKKIINAINEAYASSGSSSLTDLTDTDISQMPVPGASLIKDIPVAYGGTGDWIDKEMFYTAYLTLSAGQSTLTYTDDLITAYGSIPQTSSTALAYTRFKVYTDTPDVVPYSKSITDHTLTLKFVPQVTNVKVFVIFELQSATLHTSS